MTNPPSPITTPVFSPPPKQRSWLLRHWLPIAGVAVVFIIGVMIGGAGKAPAATAAPAPTKTVTVTEEVEVASAPVVDELCQRVAVELFSIMESNHSQVTGPLLEVNSLMYDYIMGNAGMEAITTATGKLDSASNTMEINTGRITAIGPDYRTCTD